MTLNDAARILETELPETMDSFASYSEDLCTSSLINSLQEKYDLFGEYYGKVHEALELIKKDEAMHLWLESACRYYQKADHDHARDLPVPLQDGSLARDFLPLFVMLPTVEDTYAHYRKRSFTHEETVGFLGCVKLNLSIVENRILGRPALTTGYFRWLAHYMKCTIFDYGGLNFELKRAPKTAYFLKSRTDGTVAALACREVHRSGMPLGCAGFEDEEGSFSASFEETASAYVGHPVKGFRIQKKKEAFSKEEWELFVSETDEILNVHIPRGTDLSPEKVRLAYRGALEIVKEKYPDYQPKAFLCSSWLMDPTLHHILGKDSKISQFGAPYLRLPNKSAGKEVFSFVFRPKDAEDLTKLSENTRLERALKEMYLRGEFIYAYTGILPYEKL
ncbi:MAG: hypothetical protein IKD18_00170 [Clostridia bacterium]|nr:hypothetical protein [Clostridia bacterium]